MMLQHLASMLHACTVDLVEQIGDEPPPVDLGASLGNLGSLGSLGNLGNVGSLGSLSSLLGGRLGENHAPLASIPAVAFDAFGLEVCRSLLSECYPHPTRRPSRLSLLPNHTHVLTCANVVEATARPRRLVASDCHSPPPSITTQDDEIGAAFDLFGGINDEPFAEVDSSEQVHKEHGRRTSVGVIGTHAKAHRPG